MRYLTILAASLVAAPAFGSERPEPDVQRVSAGAGEDGGTPPLAPPFDDDTWLAPRAEPGACTRPPVRLRYAGREEEAASISLTTCDGEPFRVAQSSLSILARAKDVALPDVNAEQAFRRAQPARSEAWVTEDVRRLHAGLLTRLQAIADRFPGRTLEIVSGHRPGAHRGSRHRVGRALDLRVLGVSRAHVSRFARELPDTGVGYYPNSTFTHVDVRPRATYWVDRSRPGDPPDYAPRPLRIAASGSAADRPAEEALRATATRAGTTPDRPASRGAAPTTARDECPSEEAGERRLRGDDGGYRDTLCGALAALDRLREAPRSFSPGPARAQGQHVAGGETTSPSPMSREALPPARDHEVDWTLPYW